MWRRDGKAAELYFIAPDRRLMMVSIGGGSRLAPSAPQVLFTSQISNVRQDYQNYAASADGQQFLVLVRSRESAATVVMNWPSRLNAEK